MQPEFELLKYKRPAGSYTEMSMIKKYIDPLPGMRQDLYGNRICQIGESSTMFSCHTDTMHRTPGLQHVLYDDFKKEMFVEHGECLGADDGGGIIIMIEMIKAKVPGLYIFHREEEIGGKGSKWITVNTPELVEGIEKCIAFDRKGTCEVITHQGFERCCSEDFAEQLGFALSGYWFNDDSGSFTDSANYVDLIPECTNLSIGYYKEHTSKETLDVEHLEQMISDCISLDWESLPTVRDPKVTEYLDWGNNFYTKWDDDYVDKKQGRSGATVYEDPRDFAVYADQGEVIGSEAPDFFEIDNYQEQYDWVYDYPEEATLMLRDFIQNYQRKEEVA